MPFQELMTVLAHVRPRLVYVVEERFEAEEDNLHRLDEDRGDRALLDRPRVRAVVRKWAMRDAEISTLVVALVCDGVLHVAIKEAPWLGEHEAAVDEIEDEVETAREQAQLRREKAWRTRLAPQVTQLLADERFTAGRVSHTKRMHLAGTLFPDLEKAEFTNVVTDAENRLWMQGK